MAKKKRRKSGKGRGFFGLIVSLGGAAVKGLIKGLPVITAIFIAGSAFFGMRQFLYADHGLNIQKISVEPMEALSVRQRQDLETRLIGKNILQVSLREVAARLEKDPAVQSARVTRRLPSEIWIGIHPRIPLGYVQFSPKGNYGVISEDGMILDTAAKPAPSSLVIDAIGLGYREPSIGSKMTNRGFAEIASFIDAFQVHPLAEEMAIAKMTLDANGNVTVVFNSYPPIHLGRRPAERLSAVEKMIPLLKRENLSKIDYVDVQFDNVIVKRKG